MVRVLPIKKGYMKRRLLRVLVLVCLPLLIGSCGTQDPLPSWNEGPAKQAILNFVHVTTDSSSRNFVPPDQRIATFDQDGTTWVEKPFYTQLRFPLDRVEALAPDHP